MPLFNYVARADTGVDRRGTLFAVNEDALYSALRQQDLFLLKAKQGQVASIRPEKVRLGRKQVLAFTIHLSTFLEAGIPLMEALHSLTRESQDQKFQNFVDDLILRLSSGSSLSEALLAYSKTFDAHYIEMVKAGEATGQLDERLQEMVGYLEWKQEITAQVKQSTTYPLVLIALLGGVAVILMTFTLPKFVKLLLQFDVPLPLPTRLVIGLTTALQHYWFLLPFGVMVPFLVWLFLGRFERGRLFRDRFKLSIPLIGGLQRKIALSRFAHHLSILQSAGIDALTSLKIVEGLVENRAIALVVCNIRQGVEAGETLTRRMRNSGDFPPFVVRMLAAGEETGNLEGTLKKVSQYYDREVPGAIKQIFTIMEPLILVVMGGLLIFLALAILLPIYQFGTSINH